MDGETPPLPDHPRAPTPLGVDSHRPARPRDARRARGQRRRTNADTPVVHPLFQSVNFNQEIGTGDGLRYPRYGNSPNAEIVQERVAALEGAESAVLLASGMGAVGVRAARPAPPRRPSPRQRRDLRRREPAPRDRVRDVRHRRDADRSDRRRASGASDCARRRARSSSRRRSTRRAASSTFGRSATSRRSWGSRSSSTRPSRARSTFARSSTARTSSSTRPPSISTATTTSSRGSYAEPRRTSKKCARR